LGVMTKKVKFAKKRQVSQMRGGVGGLFRRRGSAPDIIPKVQFQSIIGMPLVAIAKLSIGTEIGGTGRKENHWGERS